MTAARGSLRPLFENPVPENATLLKSLSSSWDEVKPISTMYQSSTSSSLTDIFEEVHFQEKSSSEMNSSETEKNWEKAAKVDGDRIEEHGSSMDSLFGKAKTKSENQEWASSLLGLPQKSKSTGSLQFFSEGVGLESSDEVEDSKNYDGESEEEERSERKYPIGYCRGSNNLRVLGSKRDIPPPISCIGGFGKPWISFESIKRDGRFVLRELRIPMTEYLHASRKDGRLKLHLVQPDNAVHYEEDGGGKHQLSGEDTDEAQEQEQDGEQRK